MYKDTNVHIIDQVAYNDNMYKDTNVHIIDQVAYNDNMYKNTNVQYSLQYDNVYKVLPDKIKLVSYAIYYLPTGLAFLHVHKVNSPLMHPSSPGILTLRTMVRYQYQWNLSVQVGKHGTKVC